MSIIFTHANELYQNNNSILTVLASKLVRILDFFDSFDMDTESFSFVNCSGFTYEQFTDVGQARHTTAAVCCAISFIVFLVLVILAIFRKLKLCETVAKRLTIWLTAATVPYQLVLAQPNSLPLDVESCKAYGFLVQYFGSIQFLLTLGISMVLFFKVWDAIPWKPERVDSCHKKAKETFGCCGCKINKLEVVYLVLVFGLPLLIDWIPFTTDSYGATGPWCWIRSIEKNCTIHTAGLVEQIVLWDLPFGLVVLITLVLFTASLCLLGYAIKDSKAQNVIEKVITDSIFSLVFLTVMSVLCVLEVTTRTYSFSNQRLDVWVVYAISTPLGHFFIPIALLMAIYLPLSSVIAKYTHRKQQSPPREGYGLVTLENRTLHHSSDWSLINKPSHSTWEPLHSSNEDSENVPLIHDKLKQDYKSTA